jgi:methyl-accepting chemotaxis protein
MTKVVSGYKLVSRQFRGMIVSRCSEVVDDEFAGKIHAAVAWTIVLLLVLAGVASFSVTRRTVGRIEAINTASRAIMQNGLGKKIPLRGTRDEWDQLAENLNLMLDRIEELMGEVKQVTDNVAHDLRTPLALCVIDYDGIIHALVYPCKKNGAEWVDASNKKHVDIQPTYWRKWTESH